MRAAPIRQPSGKEQDAEFLRRHYKIPYVELAAETVEPQALELLDYAFCLKRKTLPLRLTGERLTVAMADPLDQVAIDDIFARTWRRTDPLFAGEEDVSLYIERFYSSDHMESLTSAFISHKSPDHENAPEPDVQDAPAVALLDSLLETAALYQASDIHIEPFETYVRVRYRVDGRLKMYQRLDTALLSDLLGRLKVLGRMDTAEKRLPQDGHFTKVIGETAIDFRTSTLPTLYGEKAVARLIYNRSEWMHKEELGFFEEDLRRIDRLFANPYGAFLVTGPTGCGKSTTLASFLQELNQENVNIITVEDPVEHNLPGVTQVNVNPKAGLHFANALRSILRQDPDILMIGEIRDEETAKIAVQAAITGHLLLSTLHTYDALSAIVRLTDMGVEHYLVAAALKGILAQRLVRRICPRCKISVQLSPAQADILGASPDSPAFVGTGCPYCNGIGYKGRFAVYEFIAVDETLAQLIAKRADAQSMKNALSAAGFCSLRKNALRNVLEGNTTADEAIANVLFSQ